MPVLLVPNDGNPPIKFDRPILVVGRHPDCDIVLTNSRKVSRKHCCLALVNNRILVRDLGSMNGVRVNGKDVSHESPVKIGDLLQIGDVDFKVDMVEEVKRLPKKVVAPGEIKPKNLGTNMAKLDEPLIPTDVDPHMLSMDFPIALPERVDDESDDYSIPLLKD